MIMKLNGDAELGEGFSVDNLINAIAQTANTAINAIGNKSTTAATPAGAADTAGILDSFSKAIAAMSAQTKTVAVQNQVPILTIAGIGAAGLVLWAVLKKKK